MFVLAILTFLYIKTGSSLTLEILGVKRGNDISKPCNNIPCTTSQPRHVVPNTLSKPHDSIPGALGNPHHSVPCLLSHPSHFVQGPVSYKYYSIVSIISHCHHSVKNRVAPFHTQPATVTVAPLHVIHALIMKPRGVGFHVLLRSGRVAFRRQVWTLFV